MLARRIKLEHPNGTVVDLPKLVPSFSSKGFPKYRDRNENKEFSQVSLALETIGPFMKDSMLVSAYDIHFNLLRRPQRFYNGVEIVFIDSGGYEISPDFDSTEPFQPPYKGNTFTVDNYKKVLNKLPRRAPFVIANVDWDTRTLPIEGQIIAAQKFFKEFPDHFHNIILKPGGNKKHLMIDEILPHVTKLRRFHIVGFTEKELGINLDDRLVNLATLRSELDRKGVNVPIHVWGGLDPIMTPLYYFAGADIFDGVSWLRYGYYQGMAVYRDSLGVLKFGLDATMDQARALTLSDNLISLAHLTNKLRQFCDAGGQVFDMFEDHADVFKKVYRTLETRIPELKGGAR